MADKKKQEHEILPTLDFLELFNKHKTKILTGVLAVVIITTVCIIISSYTKSSEDKAWDDFTEFQRNWHTPASISADDIEIEAIFKSTEGTSAEPWAMLYCSTLYFKKREIDKAQALLAKLKEKFQNHYVCQNELLFDSVNTLVDNEKTWLAQNRGQ